MVGSLIVVYLVDWNCGVNHAGLDSLLLDYRLDSLMNVLEYISFEEKKHDCVAALTW